jgi:hypothetical protein
VDSWGRTLLTQAPSTGPASQHCCIGDQVSNTLVWGTHSNHSMFQKGSAMSMSFYDSPVEALGNRDHGGKSGSDHTVRLDSTQTPPRLSRALEPS